MASIYVNIQSRSTNPRFPTFNLTLLYASRIWKYRLNAGPLLYTQPHYYTILRSTIEPRTLNTANPHIPPVTTGCHLNLTSILTTCFVVFPHLLICFLLLYPTFLMSPSSLMIISYSSSSPHSSLTLLNTSSPSILCQCW